MCPATYVDCKTHTLAAGDLPCHIWHRETFEEAKETRHVTAMFTRGGSTKSLKTRSLRRVKELPRKRGKSRLYFCVELSSFRLSLSSSLACTHGWMLSWFENACSGHRMRPTINIIMVWQMFWSSDELAPGCSHGLCYQLHLSMGIIAAHG